ncbi:MAG: carboxyl transferase domain-containing protein [Bacteroidota bacterium]
MPERPENIRPDLQELQDRHRLLSDEERPDAIAKRIKSGHLTARQSIELIIDEGSWQEYGSLVIAAQRGRRSEEDLIRRTPTDGLITGTASINSISIESSQHKALIMAYDYTVLAGTQGVYNHMKMDRMLDIALRQKLPIILLAEGGGGRPGDIDFPIIAGLNIMTFSKYAAMRNVAPRIAVVTGFCFAGNAALAGSSDIVIATKSSSIGLGGPAMIEGGGLGSYQSEEIGPVSVQSSNGVIDILVDDDTSAMHIAKKALGYFQGTSASFDHDDQKKLREMIPQDRRRVYQVREVIQTICDTDSMLELRQGYGRSVVTALVRIQGKCYGLVANDCRKEAGAITNTAAEKMTNFLQLCDRHRLPIVSLVDCPGLMVGPTSEAEGTVRSAGELFNVSATLNVPIYAIILRRGFGLGAMAMTGGSFHAATSIVSWPSGQFGAMGIEGAVKLGFRKELAAIEDESQRQQYYDKMVEDMHHRGRAINMAAHLEIDEVIDPAKTRDWIIAVSS